MRRPSPAEGIVALLALLLFGCGDQSATSPIAGPSKDLTGVWRAVLQSPGGELPFSLEVEQDQEGQLRAWAVNGEERVPFTSVVGSGSAVTLASEGYDSEIEAQLSDNGMLLKGAWRKTVKDGDSRLPFTAERDLAGRFSNASLDQLRNAEAVRDFGGTWTATFVDEDGPFPAHGSFEQTGRLLSGTFRTTTGDYRFLEGEVLSVEGQDELRLSTFDGAHAFLFHGRFEGDELAGDFWSRDTYHASWTARRATPDDQLPNPFEQVGLTNDEGRFHFSFPDVSGEKVSADDQRFEGKVVLVDIFGSWCPNCNDSAPYLVDLDRRYRDRGLAIVGLAYEMTGDFDRDARLVERFAARHRVTFPVLVAGTSDKAEAAQTLPDLEAVLSFPTKVFIDRSGKVRQIYSGFDGPRTGSAHRTMKASMESLLEQLLAEAAG